MREPEPETYEGGGVVFFFLGLLVLVWIVRAIFSQADGSK